MLRFVRILFVTFFQTLGSRWSRGPARPAWNFGFELMIRCLRRDWDETQDWPLQKVRAEVGGRPYPNTMTRKVVVRDGDLDGVPARWFAPPNAHDGAVVLYFHGGSFIYGSPRTTHADVIARIALASGCTVVGLEYRLAPEHPYPAQLEDALRAFAALRKNARRVILAGDSAGGNLALALQRALRDRGEAQASAAVLSSPWCDLTMPGRSYHDNDPYDFGTRSVLERHAQAFTGGIAFDDPRVSPMFADLAGLAPVLVIGGGAELLRDDILALADKLEAAQVDVTRHLSPDMPHNAPLFAAYHPQARAALDAVGRYIREHAAE